MTTRGRRVGRPAWLVWGAVACGVAAAALALGSAGSPARTTPVLVARERIPAGTLLDQEAGARVLVAVPIPAGTPLAGLVADPAAVVGRRTTGTLLPGEPVTAAVVGGADESVPPLAAGERAVPVPASAAGGAAAGLAPGMRVDVVASTGEGAAGRTSVVVAGAEVLRVDPGDPRGGDVAGAGAPAVLLRASSADALRITSAVNFAREVRLLVRPPEEPTGPAAEARP